MLVCIFGLSPPTKSRISSMLASRIVFKFSGYKFSGLLKSNVKTLNAQPSPAKNMRR